MATEPGDLKMMLDCIDPRFEAELMVESEVLLELALARTTMTVACWGAHPTATMDGRAEDVLRRLVRHREVLAFGHTKSGAPQHPLYLKWTTPPILYTQEIPW